LLGQARVGQLTALLGLVAALTGCDASDLAEPSRTAAPGPGERVPARVTKHTDGDTLWLSGIGKVRLIGVDTPEVYGGVECYGREASAFVKRLLPLGARVRYELDVEERDRYGRALAYVYTADGRFLNLLLVRRGYAQPLTIPPNDRFADRFVAAARRARARKVGLWAPSACV
jgi:micrococcal nuclease